MNAQHKFSSPLARDLFALGVEAMMPHPLPELPEEAEYNFGHLQHFSTKPVFMGGTDPKQVSYELEQLQRRPSTARPHEL